MTTSLAPFLVFFVGALVVAVTRGRLQRLVLLAIPVVGLLNLLGLPDDMVATVRVLDHELVLARVDRLSMLFGYLFHLAAFLGILFALHVEDTGEQVAGVFYAGTALGAVFAGDLITLFVFWDLMAVSSVFLVLARRTDRAFRASLRYLAIQVLSGVLLLAGVLVRVSRGAGLELGPIGLGGLDGWLIFIGIGIKCGFPLVHNWLTDAYPEATPSGTVLLSAFTTKVAVYALARTYPGTEALVYIGTAMTVFPIFFAVIENDLRRVLSYSLLNQVGFMVVGVGLGTELAINGAVAHAFNDVIFKGLLFMAMGAVLFRTGRSNGSDLGGLYKSMPWTTGLCIVGACSISAFPLFSGFVSKSMVMAAAIEQGHGIVWLALLFASAGVFHHAGIKIPFFAFFAHDSGLRPREAPLHMLLAMGLAAVLCVFNGVYPWVLYSLLPHPVHYQPYTATHILAQSQLLFFSALAFAALKLTRLYPPELRSVNLDAEWVYRKAAPALLRGLGGGLVAVDRAARSAVLAGLGRALAAVERLHGAGGPLARTPSARAMVLLAVAMLAVFLLVYLHGFAPLGPR